MRRNKRIGVGHAVSFIEPYFGREAVHAKITTKPETFHRAVVKRFQLGGHPELAPSIEDVMKLAGGGIAVGKKGRKRLVYISKETAKKGLKGASVLVHELTTTAVSRFRVLRGLKVNALISEIAGNIIEMDYLQTHAPLEYAYELGNEQWPRSLDEIAKNEAIKVHHKLTPQERKILILLLAGSDVVGVKRTTEWIEKEIHKLWVERGMNKLLATMQKQRDS